MRPILRMGGRNNTGLGKCFPSGDPGTISCEHRRQSENDPSRFDDFQWLEGADHTTEHDTPYTKDQAGCGTARQALEKP